MTGRPTLSASIHARGRSKDRDPMAQRRCARLPVIAPRQPLAMRIERALAPLVRLLRKLG